MSQSGQPGNMFPRDGESEIRQGSTDADVLTIVMSSGLSTTAGAALNVRRYEAEGTSGGVSIFAVENDGVWGRRKVINVSTASSGFSPAASQSGAFCVIGDSTAKDMVITLPAAAAGLWYEFYQGGGVYSSCTKIKGTATGVLTYTKDAATVDTIFMGQATAAAIGFCMKVVSDGSKWYTIQHPAYSSVYSTAGITCPACAS